MSGIGRSRSGTKLVRLFSAALLALAAGGCMKWQRPSAVPPPDDGGGLLRAARVTPRSGMMVVLRDVRITADSVIGWRTGPAAPNEPGSRGRQRVAVHRSDVIIFERGVADPWRTAGAAALGVVVTYAAVIAYLLATMDV